MLPSKEGLARVIAWYLGLRPNGRPRCRSPGVQKVYRFPRAEKLLPSCFTRLTSPGGKRKGGALWIPDLRFKIMSEPLHPSGHADLPVGVHAGGPILRETARRALTGLPDAGGTGSSYCISVLNMMAQTLLGATSTWPLVRTTLLPALMVTPTALATSPSKGSSVTAAPPLTAV